MDRYKSLFESVEVKGDFGDAGWLSKKTITELWDEIGSDVDYIAMNVNQELMNMSVKSDNIGKTLNAMKDYRVSGDEYHGKLAIRYPKEIYGNKKLINFYHTVLKRILKRVG